MGGTAHALDVDHLSRHAKSDVLRQGTVGKVNTLWHMSDGPLPCAHTRTGNRLPIHQQPSFARDQQTHQQIQCSALSATGDPNEADPFSFGDGKGQSVEYPGAVSVIPETYTVELYRVDKMQRLRRRVRQLGRHGLFQQF